MRSAAVRSCIVSFFLFCAAVAYSQSDDPRLAVQATLHEHYMTLAEFGQFVADKAHVSVSVDPAISERKVTIFCEDKPLGQIVQRVTETLLLEWSKDHGSYVLRLPKEIANEERSIVVKRNQSGILALRGAIQKLIELTRYSPEQLAEEATELEKSIPEMSKDNSTEGQRKLHDATTRDREIQSFTYTRQRWDMGDALAKASPDDLAGLERGNTIYASTPPYPDTIRLSPEAYTKNRTFSGQQSSPNPFVLLTLHYEAYHQRLVAHIRSTSFAGGDADLMGPWSWDPSKEPLVLRLAKWPGSKDDGILDTPLNREAKLPESDPDGAWTLADHLQWLHDRCGIPIVADAYRNFASFNEPINATTLKDWMDQAHAYDYAHQRLWDWPMFKTDQGWLMVKDRNYWDRLAGEVPERYIRPLEAKFKAKKALWIEDYMAYAAVLTESQEDALSDRVVHFPVQPLPGHVTLLKLWNACGDSGRKRAAHGGLSLASMGTKIEGFYYEVLRKEAIEGLMDQSLVVNFMPGGPALPPDMCLFYEDTTMPGVEVQGQTSYPVHMRVGTGYRGETMQVAGARFSFGTSSGPRASVSIQVAELKK